MLRPDLLTLVSFLPSKKARLWAPGRALGVQGDIPLGGQWSIDWLAGAAVLFGERSVQVTSTSTGTAGSTTLVANASDSPAIFNVDAEAGLSY